jgi:hypothetical protein
LIEELRGWVGEQLSPIAKPDEIRLTDNLPKTRSGKIMRRLLRAVARGEEITQDMSTLENPAIIEQLRGLADAPAKAAAARKRPAQHAAQKSPKKPVKKAARKSAARTPKKRAKSAAKKAGHAAKPLSRSSAARGAAARKARAAPKRAKSSKPKARAARRKK